MWGWGRREAGCTKSCAADSSLAALGLSQSWTLRQTLSGASRAPHRGPAPLRRGRDTCPEKRLPPGEGAGSAGGLLALRGSGTQHEHARHQAVRENHLQGTSRTAGPSSWPALHPQTAPPRIPGLGTRRRCWKGGAKAGTAAQGAMGQTWQEVDSSPGRGKRQPAHSPALCLTPPGLSPMFHIQPGLRMDLAHRRC